MTWMIIRLILSLGFVALVLFYAARLAKKRGLGQGNGVIEVVARQRMGRTSTVNVIRLWKARAARESFVDGWQQAMWAGVTVMAVLLLYVLPRGPKDSVPVSREGNR